MRRAAAAVAIAAAALAGCRGGATRGEIRLADALERLALGDSTAALTLLESARFDMPHDHRVLFHYGRLLARTPDPEARARAERALRTAIDRAPEVARYHEELGLLLQTQGFHSECKAELQQAVARDPRLGRAWRALGSELLHDWREEPMSEAIRDSTLRCFQAALAADPGDAEARYAFACLMLFGAGAVDEARAVCAPVLEASGCNSRFMLLAVAIEARARRYPLACAALERALHCLTPDERSAWIGAQSVIPPDSAGAWALWTQSQKDSISEEFWFALDPTPATLDNERLVEHVARRCEADFRFVPHRRNRPGCATDRGEVFVRWGQPVAATRGITGQARSWHWTYGTQGDVTPEFLFLDRYLNGDYVRWRRSARADFMHPEPLEVAAQRTALDFGARAREFHWLAARFRGDGGRVAIEWAFETAEDSTAVAVQAAAWNGPRRLAGTCAIAAANLMRRSNRLVGRARLEVAPPASEVALQVHAPEGPQGRGWRHAARHLLTVAPADPDTLQMSDLLPAYGLAEGLVADPRLAVRVPRADSLVEGGELHVYFEIYPSRSARADTRRIAVTYGIQALPPSWRFRDQFNSAARARQRRRDIVASTFELLARREREPQRLTVDVARLEPGPYVFAVSVRDPAMGDKVERRWSFYIPDDARTGEAGGSQR